MSATTPGPWQITPPQNGGCSLGDGLYVQHVDGRPIAFASSGNPADAVLIVAAPALLAKLKECAGDCAECDGHGTLQFDDPSHAGHAGDSCPGCAHIHAVIAKAEGLS